MAFNDPEEAILPADHIPDAVGEEMNDLWGQVRQSVHRHDTPPRVRESEPPSQSRESESNIDQSLSDSLSQSVPTDEASLHGLEDDPLIPSEKAIRLTWCRGKATWSTFLQAAMKGWPDHFENPAMALKDVPALPRFIPKGPTLSGFAVWRRTNLSGELEEARGNVLHFPLTVPKPLICRLSVASRPSDDWRYPESISVLILCWAYILSARILEHQGRGIRYTQHVANSSSIEVDDGTGVIVLPSSASSGLFRWLCALLAPFPTYGWVPEDHISFTPWTTFISSDIYVKVVSDFVLDDIQTSAPTSLQASRYLTELCEIFSLGDDTRSSKDVSQPYTPYTAAFVAALLLPYYGMEDLRPQLPTPSLVDHGRAFLGGETANDVEHYVRDLPYYMTMSVRPFSLDAVLWSIFWHPQVECNLVSPWFGSILHVIRPILQENKSELLVRLFAARRPKVAIWWLGLLLLGDRRIYSFIHHFLETHTEKPIFLSTGSPDITMAAWTGVSLSFWEEQSTKSGLESAGDQGHVLRSRRNLNLHEDWRSIPFSWRPFGRPGYKIKPTMLTYLQSNATRDYLRWQWFTYPKSSCQLRHESRMFFEDTRSEIPPQYLLGDGQQGYRRDTGHVVNHTPDYADFLEVRVKNDMSLQRLNVGPSKRSVLRMLGYCVWDLEGNRSLEAAGLPMLQENHPWLRRWRGLE